MEIWFYWTLLLLLRCVALGGANVSLESSSANIISIYAGAFILTIPVITKQRPKFLLACQKKQQKRLWLFKGMPRFLWILDFNFKEPEEEEEEEEEKGFFISDLHSESIYQELDETSR